MPRLAAEDFRKRHLETSVQHVGNGRQATVEQDIASLRERFLFQFDNILKRKVASGDRADKFKLFVSGNIRSARPAMSPSKT